MIGILAHGDNHFIVEGLRPDDGQALALVRHWSVIGIGTTTPESLAAWRIITRAFREELEWAIVVPGDAATSPAVATLLDELSARGVLVRRVAPPTEKRDPCL